MVVGAPVTEAEFENRPGQRADRIRGKLEAGALGLEAPDEAVQSAQRCSP